MKRILDSWPVALVRLLANGVILVVGVAFLISWFRGEPFSWTQLSSAQPVAIEEHHSSVGVLRMEIVVPRECVFHCGLGSDHLVVKTANPTQVHLSVRREDVPTQTVASSAPDPHSQR